MEILPCEVVVMVNLGVHALSGQMRIFKHLFSHRNYLFWALNYMNTKGTTL